MHDYYIIHVLSTLTGLLIQIAIDNLYSQSYDLDNIDLDYKDS